ncbi:MAG: PEP-CTERM sorting domain-containing protein [Planctomycetota bacterium]
MSSTPGLEAVVVGNTGTLSPGNSPGILTVNSLSLSGSAFTLMEIVGSGSTAGVAGTAYDQVAVTNADSLSFGGTLHLDFGNRSSLFAQGTIFQLFSFAGTATGDFTTIRTIDSSGSYANLTFTQSPYVPGEWTTGIIGGSGNQYLVFSENTGRLVALPEPSAVAMAALGAGLAGWRLVLRRRDAIKAAA